MKQIQITAYESFDGKEFRRESECAEYERQARIVRDIAPGEVYSRQGHSAKVIIAFTYDNKVLFLGNNESAFRGYYNGYGTAGAGLYNTKKEAIDYLNQIGWTLERKLVVPL